MQVIAKRILLLLLALPLGCQTVHSSHPGDMPVAMWVSLDQYDQQGQVARANPEPMVLKVLRENGLHPSVDHDGVAVPPQEVSRAQEVLLTDQRLHALNVTVFLGLPAGCAKKTKDGYEISNVTVSKLVKRDGESPGELMIVELPSTQPTTQGDIKLEREGPTTVQILKGDDLRTWVATHPEIQQTKWYKQYMQDSKQ